MSKFRSFGQQLLWAAAIATGITLAAPAGGTSPVLAQRPEDQTQNHAQSLTSSHLAASTSLQQVRTQAPAQLFEIPFWVYPAGAIVFIVIFLPNIGWIAGLIVIGDRDVGIVTKKFSTRSLPAGKLIALNGEAGLQADTLPPGWHFGYFPWQFKIAKMPLVVIPQGEIGLIVASDGSTIPSERILGKVVDSDDFQNARKFLTNGGEKGKQLGILTAGTYRINTALFEVLTSSNLTRVANIAADQVGIVTTMDGLPIEAGEIAGPVIPGHDNFQKPQLFLNHGGQRGLQEQIVLSGNWNLNPWFTNVQTVPMTEVPIGYVGVVISFVGDAHEDVSGDAFTHGDLVQKGDKGVWAEPLYPGKHPLNTKIMKTELVPTTNIILNFTSRFSGEHGYDSKLNALKLLSYDGFTFELEVFQIIHVGATDAPKVISRLGSMQNLVDQVLRPIVGNYFRNAAQEYTILDFLSGRSERQAEAAEHVRQALRAYDVQAVDTLIGLITPPPELMETLTQRKIAEEQKKTYEVQREAQSQRQELVRETSLADIQQEVVTAEQGVKIAELHATAAVSQAQGKAEAVRLNGEAQAQAYQAGVNALGSQAYTALQAIQVIGNHQVRVVPDVSVVGGNGNGGGNSGSGMLDAIMAMMLWQQQPKQQQTAPANGYSAPTPSAPTTPTPTSSVNSLAVIPAVKPIPENPSGFDKPV
jgi:uncharacterized membrane protein YqiK